MRKRYDMALTSAGGRGEFEKLEISRLNGELPLLTK
jgi:hypothetical protein